MIVLLALATQAAAQTSAPVAPGVRLEEAWIPMVDGVRLSVDLWRPTDSGSATKFPVLLEYLPYRKADGRGNRLPLYAYFVRRGYVVARVDIRGTGTSEGTLIPHEYSEIELRDGEAVIDWLAKQQFSTGKVGMFGISWGGFNSIQLAMRRPPALQTIIAVDATDDLYQDDVHFIDGMMHVDSWEMNQDLSNIMPGAPDFVVDDRYFAERFDQPPWMLVYKAQQRDGPFWDRASLKTNYAAIEIPTFLIGGWYDGYRDAIPRMLEKMSAPVKAIIGAWHHTFPDSPYPNPGIEWRHEAVRWFDHWLKGRESGIMTEPRLATYIRQWHPPGPYLDSAPGFWRGEDRWPVARIRDSTVFLGINGSISADPPRDSTARLRYHPTSGVEAGGPVMWHGDVAPDQRPTDAMSLVFETEPVPKDLEILGFPRAILEVSADAPQAHWFARLSDVAPDGTVTLITGAGQNGAHRLSARNPTPIAPGRRFPLEIELHVTSWVVPRGHRLRLSVSNAQWPMIWPTPFAMTTALYVGSAGSRLVIPVVPPGSGGRAVHFRPIDTDRDRFPGYERIEAGTTSGYGEISSVDRNPATGATRVTATSQSAGRYPWGEERNTESTVHEAIDGRPDSTTVRGNYSTTVTLRSRTLRWEVSVVLWSDRERFHYQHTRRLFQNDALLRERSWSRTFPRDHQ